MSQPALVVAPPARWSSRMVARVRANDPGNMRLHLALSLVLSAAASALVCWIVARWTGQLKVVLPRPDVPGASMAIVSHPIAVVMGAMSALLLAFAPLPSAPRSRLLFMLSTGPMLVVGFVLGAEMVPSKVASIVTMCGLATGMVLLQRAPRVVPFSLPLLVGTLLAIFMKLQLGQIPWSALIVAIGSAVSIGIHLLLFWPRPERTLGQMRRVFAERSGVLLETAIDLLADDAGSERQHQRLRKAIADLEEIGLVLDAHLAGWGWGLDQVTADRVHQTVFDQEGAYHAVARAVIELARSQPTDMSRRLLANALSAVRSGDLDGARTEVERLVTAGHAVLDEGTPDSGAPRATLVVEYHAAVALHDLVGSLAEVGAPLAVFRPTVRTAGGMLLRSGPSAVVAQRSGRTGSPRRPFPPDIWHRAVRMLIAASVAAIVGDVLSPVRWYWAFFTAFSVMSAANTAAEHLRAALDRALGTAAGVLLGVAIAHLVADAPIVSFGVLFAAAGIAFYFQRWSNVLNTLAMAVMVTQLYVQLHTYTDRLLLTRMTETAVGAAIAIVVSLTVYRVRTSDVAQTAVFRYLDALEHVVRSATAHLAGAQVSTDLRSDVRVLQDIQRQLSDTVLLPTALGREARTPAQLTLLGSITNDATRLARRADSFQPLDGELRHEMLAVGTHLTAQIADVRQALTSGKAVTRSSTALDALDSELRGRAEPLAREQLATVRELAMLDEHLLELAESIPGAAPASVRPSRMEIVRPLPNFSRSFEGNVTRGDGLVATSDDRP